MIRLENVTKRYPRGSRLDALHHVSLSVERGEFVFLTGASGAGKSTLLRLIPMEEFPTEGDVIVDGFSSSTITRGKLPVLRQRIGVVFQDFRLWRDWTIGENVAAAVRVTGVFDPAELRSRTQEALHRVGLAHRARHYPSQLSGGEVQRVAIARAIVNNPIVLLADEPTGNLDAEVGWSIFQLLKSIQQQGTSVIAATHNVQIVQRIGGRVVHLDQGRQVEDREIHVAS